MAATKGSGRGGKARSAGPSATRFAPQPPDGPSLAEQAVRRSTELLVAARTDEAELLLAAALEVMVDLGLERRATVADIVRKAGLSNQAFYRHFVSKDDLVAALVDAGARRLVSYLDHHMAVADEPAAKVQAWTRGVLSQAADPEVAAPTKAVAWNRNPIASDAAADAQRAESMIWVLLEEPLRAMGRPDPASEAYLVGRLVFAVLDDVLWADPAPTLDELEFVGDFVLARLEAPGAAAGSKARRTR
ncbi:MAG TPA: TetR/AcrR family transcriptional regulator [Acidimicrobiales bacterium]